MRELCCSIQIFIRRAGRLFIAQRPWVPLSVCALLLALLGTPVPSAQALDLFVENTEDNGPGSLREMILTANELPGADTIKFVPLLSSQSITLTSGALRIAGDLTISGPVGGITISGQEASGVLRVDPGTVKLEHLILRSGGGSSGSGLENYGTLTVESSTISDNHAIFGGGVANFARLTLINSTVEGNTADTLGGGIFNANQAMLTLANVTLSGNRADRGGAIYNDGEGTAIVMNATIVDNQARQGGGVSNPAGAVTLTNTVMAGHGDGQSCDGKIPTDQSAKNLQDQLPQCGPSFTVILDLRRLLGPLADNGGVTQTHALLSNNPAVNGGTNDVCPGVDQRGADRPASSQNACDIGAFEAPSEGQPAPVDRPNAPAVAVPSDDQLKTMSLVINVTSLADGVSGQAGACTAAARSCTLREAVLLGNRLASATIAIEQSGEYVLSLPGSDDVGIQGDLDVTGDITIVNASQGRATIKQTVATRVIEVHAGAKLTLLDMTISGGNTAEGAGILVNPEGTAIVRGSTLTGNQATTNGGGIFTNGALRLFNSTVSGNSAAHGGGIFAGASGDLGLTNVTISNNTAATGAGVESAGPNPAGQIVNTIIASQANSGENCRGTVAARFSSNNIQSVGATCGEGFAASPNEKLLPLTDNGGRTQTHALGDGGVAFRGGLPGACQNLAYDDRGNIDQRGITRPANCDIGAYESEK